MTKCYSELIKLPTFNERLEYLLLYGTPGSATFGHHRFMNQKFYSSYEWKKFKRDITIRDMGCDLACPEFPIQKGLYIHHINPITLEDIAERSSRLLDPENVICVSFNTHQLIHYANVDLINSRKPSDRQPNDTIPWR